MENSNNENYKMEEKQQQSSSDASESESRIDGELVLRDLMDVICQYLNSKDLSSVAQVCQSWKEEASKEMSKRHFEFKVWPGSCNKDPSFEISTYLNNTPHVTLLFPSSGCADHLDLERETLKAYRKHFPNKLIVIGAFEYTLDKNFIRCLPLVRYEEDLEQRVVPHATLSLSLPLSKSLNIKEGWVLKSEYNEDPSTLNRMIESLLVIDNTESKSTLLLFIANPDYMFDENWVEDELQPLFKRIKSRFPEKPYTLWGFTTVYNMYASDFSDTGVPGEEAKEIQFFGLKLFGPTVESWTKTISIEDSKSEVFKELKSFRKKINLKQYSMGFITIGCRNLNEFFADVKGYCCYRRNVSYVKKVFSEIPFLGSYVDPFDHYSLVATPEDSEDKKIMQYGHIISILILTY